jgi:membrane protein
MTAMRQRARELVVRSGVSAWQAFLNFYNSDDLTYAASMAYYSLLSLFPLLMLTLAVLGWATGDVESRNAVLDFLLRYFPSRFEFITTQLDALRNGGMDFGVAGTIGLVWGGLAIFGMITTAINYAWGVEKTPNFWQHKLTSAIMLLISGFILLTALLLVSASKIASSLWFAGIIEQAPGLRFLTSFAVRYSTTLLFIGVITLLFRYVPNKASVSFADVWLGAMFTGLLWRLTLELFSWYLEGRVRQLARINGSIAVVVMFLVWVYVQAVIFLYGVEFTAVYARLRREPTLPPDPDLS